MPPRSPASSFWTVAVPWARLTVKTTGTLPELPGPSADVRAPEGGSFVGVAVRVDDKQLLPMPRAVTATAPVVQVELVADGRDYPVTGLLDAALSDWNVMLDERARYVAVAGRAKDLRLKLTVDGQSRTVDLHDGTADAGLFAWDAERSEVGGVG